MMMDMGQEGSLLAKSKWNKNQNIIFLRLGSLLYTSTHFLSYDCQAAHLGINSRFNYEFEGLYDKQNIIIGSSSLLIW